MVEVITILSGIGAGLVGIMAWFEKLPPWMGYAIFLAGLGADVAMTEFMKGAGILQAQGVAGWIVTQAFYAFGFTNVFITSGEIMLLALFIPLIGLFFNLYH